jgi:hypothetical protein
MKIDLSKKVGTSILTRKQVIIRIVVIIVFTVVAEFVASIIDNKNKNSLFNNEGFTTGEIIKRVYFGKNGNIPGFMWQATLKNKTYTYHDKVSDSFDCRALVGHKFPVIYDTSSNNYYQILGSQHILIFPENFKYYNIPYPDSLKWVLKYRIK